MIKICKICDKLESKYKCPCCEIPYCSTICFKLHKSDKDSCQRKLETNTNNESEHKGSTLLFTTMDTVKPEKLDELRNCEPLKNLLQNPHLRSLLKELDGAKNPNNAIKSAMMEPLFLEFANECLKIVEPVDEAAALSDI